MAVFRSFINLFRTKNVTAPTAENTGSEWTCTSSSFNEDSDTYATTYYAGGHSSYCKPENWRDKLLAAKPWTYYTQKRLEALAKKSEVSKPIERVDVDYHYKMIRIKDKFKFQGRNG